MDSTREREREEKDRKEERKTMNERGVFVRDGEGLVVSCCGAGTVGRPPLCVLCKIEY